MWTLVLYMNEVECSSALCQWTLCGTLLVMMLTFAGSTRFLLINLLILGASEALRTDFVLLLLQGRRQQSFMEWTRCPPFARYGQGRIASIPPPWAFFKGLTILAHNPHLPSPHLPCCNLLQG